MRILGKKWLMLAAAVPVAALIACSSDAPVQVLIPSGQVYDEDEYNELVEAGMVDEMGNVIEEDEEVTEGADAQKSSSSGSKTTSSSDSKTASSSDAKTTSSSDSKTTSSDSKTESSSSAKASSDSGSDKSSSSAVTSSTGSEGTSSEGGSGDTVKSSSSAAGDVTSSAESATSSSAVAGVDTYETSGGDVNVGTNDMTPVDEDEKAELDDLKEQLKDGPVDGFENVGTTINGADMDFDGGGDYYCFTGEGEWLHVSLDQLGEHINHFRNGAAWGQLKKFDILFMDACEGVYFRRKS